jgi:hypothetical protein
VQGDESEPGERSVDGVPRSPAVGLGALLAALGPLLIALAVTPAYPRLGPGASLLTGALGDPLASLGAQPLAALGARALAQLPLGSLALRTNLSSALWLGLAAAALYRALDLGLHALGLRRALLASPLALGAVWLTFGSAALAPSAVLGSAAALALAALALERMAAALEQSRLHARVSLRRAAIWQALLLIEQPLLGCALALGSAPALLLGLGERGGLLIRVTGLWLFVLCVWSFAVTSVGNSPLLALELQAPSLTALRELGGANSARALLAAGAIGLVRVRALRGPFGLFVGVALVLVLAACLAVDAAAPARTLLPLAAMLATGALGRALIARPQGWLAHACALAAVALGLGQLQAEGRRALPHDGGGNELLSDELRTSPPPRAVCMTSPDTLRALRAAELEERVRPDLVLIPGPFRLGLFAASALGRTHPELRALLRAQLLSPAHLLPELQGLAAQRPLLIELDPNLPRELRAALVPHGLWHALVTSDVSKSDLRIASASSDARLDRLLVQLDPISALPELRAALAVMLIAAAEQATSVGDTERAQRLRQRADAWR